MAMTLTNSFSIVFSLNTVEAYPAELGGWHRMLLSARAAFMGEYPPGLQVDL